MGLAQARHPLSTRSHYFEVEIVDPGEKCYIALGLARKVGIVFAYRASQLRAVGMGLEVLEEIRGQAAEGGVLT